MTPTEEFVSKLCCKSFLTLWSFPNPIGKKGKELCDLLVICDPYIIIISVKEIIINPSKNFDVDVDRWLKRAIDDSVKQIYGAERIIELKDEITLKNATTKVLLPTKESRKIYRIAVAFGRGENFPLKYGNLGKGFVHAFDEKSIEIILNELDTISDFVYFLDSKEKYILSGANQIAFSAEDYLGLHLGYGFEDLGDTHDMVYISDDIWEGHKESDYYKEEKALNVESYLWDEIIETISKNQASDDNKNLELALRFMCKENRFARRQLSKMFNDLIFNLNNRLNSRIAKLDNGEAVCYVFLTRPLDEGNSRLKELELRCIVARLVYPNIPTIIGLATSKRKSGEIFSVDFCYHHFPEITNELRQKAFEIQKEFGYFKNAIISTLKPNGKYL